MEASSVSKKPPRNFSKQKSCGNILQQYQTSEKSETKRRVCVTPNSKTPVTRRLQSTTNTFGSRLDLKKSPKSNTDGSRKLIRSGSRKTPSCPKNGTPALTTPRCTPVSTKTPLGLFNGKTKRDSEKRKELRPKKRLAVANESDNYFAYQESYEGDCKHVPVAEIKPMPISNNLCESDFKMADGTLDDSFNRVKSGNNFSVKEISVNTGKKNIDVGTCVDSGNFSVFVAVRVRPFSEREEQNTDVSCVVEVHENSICVTETNGNPHHFTYDMSLWSFDTTDQSYASQEKVYTATAKPLLEGVIQGYNTCLFAYGQTGSGKSYTMTGYEGDETGVIPRFCEELFKEIHSDRKKHFSVEISFFEIYNEKIRDLLTYSPDSTKQLRIREHPEQGPYVQDLSVFTVTGWEDIEGWLAVGNKNRATAATGMNDRSSRSHSVFTILLNQSETGFFEDTETHLSKSCKVNLIDLAGSERANQVINGELAADYEAANNRLKEGSCINRSLHTLGKVISLLSEKQTGPKKKIFIPYRDSTLTWLLRESLGGNSRTAMIATISPASIHISETLSTLRYARQARNIVNQARVNEDNNAKTIRELLREIERLKDLKTDAKEDIMEPTTEEVEILKSKLVEANEILSRTAREWESKLQLSELRWKEETERIKQSGLVSHVSNSFPSLVNLNEDPMLTEILVYVLKDGKTTFGNSSSQESYDIKLNGPLVADFHCCITNENKQVNISPTGDAPVYVNGEQISSSATLKHGDRIVIGGSHFFRFNNPSLATDPPKKLARKPSKRELRRKWDGLKLKDFEFAKRELTQQQNARLEAELEESQVKAQEDLIDVIASAKENAERQLSLQREAYKDEIADLQNRLEEAECKRRIAEKDRHLAEDQIVQLRSHKQALEEEVQTSRRRLHEEALTAKQAFEETRANQLTIISELEKEKKRIEDDVHNLKSKKFQRNLVRNEIRTALTSCHKDGDGKKDLLKIALLLREANKISEKLQKDITFSRDDILEDDKVEIRIRLNDTKHGRTTLWSLDKFEFMVGKMRDLYQANGILEEGEDDPFHDSLDEWLDDFTLDSPTTPQPNLNSTRLSIGRRVSLNHSLHLLTNLNASLSELSKRRKSSINGSTFQDGALPSACFVNIKNLIDVEKATEDKGCSTTKHMLSLLFEIRAAIATLQRSKVANNQVAKETLNVAILLARLKECGESWARMHRVINYTSIEMYVSSLDSRICKLIAECNTVFQTTKIPYQCSERILDALADVVKSVGELSLLSADCFEDSYATVLPPCEDKRYCRVFAEGQHSIWINMINECSNALDNSLQELRGLQLDMTEKQTDVDLDDLVNLLNSKSVMLQNVKEFMDFCFEERHEDLSLEKCLLIQRHVIRNLTKLLDKTKGFVLRIGTLEVAFTKDTSSLRDQLKCISQCCKDIIIFFKLLVEQLSCSDDAILSIKDTFEKLEFAMKAVQVGVAIISQHFEELCFPHGDYSFSLEEDMEDNEFKLCNEAVICPLSLSERTDLSATKSNQKCDS